MVDVLVATHPNQTGRYQRQFASATDLRMRLVTETRAALLALADRAQPTDVLVLDNRLANGFDLVGLLRRQYPRLTILLVDEGADFATPGQADDISTDPFTNDDLVERIRRLLAERQLETLRADSMPPVRELAKRLRKALGEIGKVQTVIALCLEMRYDYAALYRLESAEPLKLSLRDHDGLPAALASAPKVALEHDLVGWVARSGQSRIVTPEDDPNHPLVRKGMFRAAAVVPIGITNRYGVLVAGKTAASAIHPQQMLLLELICAQFASAITKETE